MNQILDLSVCLWACLEKNNLDRAVNMHLLAVAKIQRYSYSWLNPCLEYDECQWFANFPISERAYTMGDES